MNNQIPISEFRAHIKKYTDALLSGEVDHLLLSKNNEDFFELRYLPDQKPVKHRLGALAGRGGIYNIGLSQSKIRCFKGF